MTTDNRTLADVQPGGRVRLGTPGARWAATGEPDPHGTRYDCERSDLAMGNLSDDELANAVFINGDRNPTFAQMTSGELPGSAYLTAAKDRIRWLSRALAAAEALSAQPSPGGQGDARSFVIAAYRKDGKHSIAAAMEDGSYFPPYVQRAVNAVEAALAARQPVGEPAMYQVRPRSFPAGEGWREVSKRQFDDRGEFPGYPEAEWERRTLYAAAPAQVVDLSMLIAKIDQAWGYLSTALDDLDSSPDRRPSVMVDEAMGCLRQALTGVPNG